MASRAASIRKKNLKTAVNAALKREAEAAERTVGGPTKSGSAPKQAEGSVSSGGAAGKVAAGASIMISGADSSCVGKSSRCKN